jgi:hypothetical protein
MCSKSVVYRWFGLLVHLRLCPRRRLLLHLPLHLLRSLQAGTKHGSSSLDAENRTLRSPGSKVVGLKALLFQTFFLGVVLFMERNKNSFVSWYHNEQGGRRCVPTTFTDQLTIKI